MWWNGPSIVNFLKSFNLFHLKKNNKWSTIKKIITSVWLASTSCDRRNTFDFLETKQDYVIHIFYSHVGLNKTEVVVAIIYLETMIGQNPKLPHCLCWWARGLFQKPCEGLLSIVRGMSGRRMPGRNMPGKGREGQKG